jgi:hypothetical protein
MFSKSFNISDVVEKKSNLKHVSETTITQLDGSRYIQNNQNGSLSELASGSKDEDGQWADLDEAEALGLSATGDFSELHGHLGNPAWDAPTLASYSNTLV